MTHSNLKNRSSLKVIALVLGLAISGLIVGQGLTHSNYLEGNNDSFSSLKESIKKNKNLIVNTYLLGVSIYKEAVD